jgi:hypothetical protein
MAIAGEREIDDGIGTRDRPPHFIDADDLDALRPEWLKLPIRGAPEIHYAHAESLPPEPQRQSAHLGRAESGDKMGGG